MSSLTDIFSDANKNSFDRVIKFNNVDKSVDLNLNVSKPENNENIKKTSKLSDEKKLSKKRQRVENNAKVVISSQVEVDSKETETLSEGKYQDITKDDRTIFVGNISKSQSLKRIRALFEEYGEIESLRIRSVPVSGTAVDEHGNQNLVKKVCVNSKKYGDQKGSFNAYIVYKSKDSVNLAIVGKNNVTLDKRHLRVDSIPPSLFDNTRTVFLGGVPHYADEEQIREHFAQTLTNGHDDIEGIRIIRDPQTLVGKGIAYLLLKDRDAILNALTLNGSLFKKKYNLRVMTCGKRYKRQNQKN